MLVLGLTPSNATASAAEKPKCDLAIAETVTVTSANAFDAVRLKDLRTLRLANIQMISHEPSAQQWLVSQLNQKEVQLAYDKRATDRDSKLVAQVYSLDRNVWLQAELVNAGYARVYSWPSIRACANTLLKLEAGARQAGRGLWAEPQNQIRTPEQLAATAGTFQIVEGRVRSVSIGRERSYLNFGENYRTDFTITISKRDMKLFTAAGIDPKTYDGKNIRARGWVGLLNGPEIEATHPEQIELVAAPSK